MAWDDDYNKTLGNERGWNKEGGYGAFTTTGLTVEIATKFATVKNAIVTQKSTPSPYEQLFCDGTVTSGHVTVTRQLQVVRMSAMCLTEHIASNNYTPGAVMLGRAPVAGALTKFTIYNTTKAGGSPLVHLGTLADTDKLIATAAAIVPPDSGVTEVHTSGFTTTAVAAGDIIVFGTVNGASTDPAGGFVEVEITPTPTSALEFYYQFMGL